MPVPKIKIYQLPPGYSTSNDSDVQSQSGDELLPCTQKSQLLADAVLLTGVMPLGSQALPPANLQPVNLTAGAQMATLVPPSGTIQTPEGISYSEVLLGVTGYLAPTVLDSTGAVISQLQPGTVPPSGQTFWQAGATGIQFTGPPPAGATLACFMRASTPATHWALPGSFPYEARNTSFNVIRISVNGGPYVAASPAQANSSHPEYGQPWVVTPAASGVQMTGAVLSPVSKYFIGESPNWIVEHLNMWPDIFVGAKNYPGDSYTQVVGGVNQYIVQGAVPEYVAPGGYTLSIRDGMVSFSAAVDSTANPVRANYAHLVDIANVTGQVLDPVVGASGRLYGAASEQAYVNSHGKRWVGRSDNYVPTNIYVNGQLTPVVQSVQPYDTLTVKTSL